MLPELGTYLKKLKAAHDEDAVDRLNYLYTIFLLLSFSILLSAKQYVGEPLQCWVPHQFKEGWEKYVERHCFIENTYFTRLEDKIPESSAEKKDRELAYYQWLPIMLALQAALCYAPRMIWRLLNKSSGLNLTDYIPMSMMTTKKGKQKELREGENLYEPLVEHLKKNLEVSRQNKSIKFGKFVTILYLVIKGLWLVNIILQFVVLDVFLGPEYTLWGIGIIGDLFHGRHWKESGHFPRVTMCDVMVREMGNVHTWTVQCVLMVNMFAEKIFIFLWFWFCFVGIVTILNLAYWIYVTFLPSQPRSFVRKYLEFNKIEPRDSEIDSFIHTMLRMDGLTIMRLISDNSGDLAVADIMAKLWENRLDKESVPPAIPDTYPRKADNRYDEEDLIKDDRVML